MLVDWAGIGAVLDKLISLLAAAGVFIGVYFAAKAKWEAEKAKLEAERATAESKLTTSKVATLDDTVERNAKATSEEMSSVKADVKKVEVNIRGQLLGMAEQKETGKVDAAEVREQIKEATDTLAKVKVTGEDTNKVVEEVKEIVKNGNHPEYKP